jgi:hypothetical protein
MDKKIEKYMNRNHKITDEQLIAKNKLINIKNQLIEQIGGGKLDEIKKLINDSIKKIDTLSYDTSNIIKLINDNAIEHNITDIDDLIKADEEMTKQCQEFNELFKDDKTFDNHEEIKNQLLNIYKALFLLQVKIIFSKVNEIIVKNPKLKPKEVEIKGIVKKRVKELNKTKSNPVLPLNQPRWIGTRIVGNDNYKREVTDKITNKITN